MRACVRACVRACRQFPYPFLTELQPLTGKARTLFPWMMLSHWLLGRPKKVTAENREELQRLKAQRREDYLKRIPIEGKFGQGKNGYRLNYIRAKRADTSVAWINSILLVMNLLILLRIIFAPIMKGVWGLILRIRQWNLRLGGHWLFRQFGVAEYDRLQPLL